MSRIRTIGWTPRRFSFRVGSLVGLVLLLAWGWFDVRGRGRIDPASPEVHRTDFTVYTAAGHALRTGADPYLARSPRGWRYLYPPLAAILVIPFTWLSSQDGVLVWFLVSLALAYGCWIESRRLVRAAGVGVPSGVWNGLAAWAGLAIVFPLLNGLQRGQFNVLVLYCLLLGLRLVVTGRRAAAWVLGGVALAAAGVLKLTPALVVVYVAALVFVQPASGRMRAVLVSCGVGAGVFLLLLAVPAGVSGWSANVRHLQTWANRVILERDLRGDAQVNPYSVRNQSLSNALFSFGNWFMHVVLDGPDDRVNRVAGQKRRPQPMDTPAFKAGVFVACVCLALMLGLAGWRLARGNDSLGLVAAFGLACCATLLLSPLSWGHHYLLWWPGALFVSAWVWRRAPRAGWALALAPAVVLVTHYALVEHAGRIGVLGIGATGWYMGACVAVGRLGGDGAGHAAPTAYTAA